MVNYWINLTIVLLLSSLSITTQNSSISSEIELQNSAIIGGSCLDIIDPNTSSPSIAFVVDTICQGEVMDFCLTTAGCNTDVNITNVTGNLGQVIITPPTSPFDHCISYTAPTGLVGEDSFTLTVTNSDNDGNVTATSVVELTFVVVDPSFPTSVTPPQELCSPANSTFIEAINPDPIIEGYWVILQGGGTIADVNDPVTEVTNIPFGESIYMWRQDYPCQSSFDLTSVSVYDGTAPVADSGPDAVICSFDDSYTMQANDPLFSATGTWEITFGNATINDINDPNAEVTTIGIGVNVFEWNIDNGPCPGGETVSVMTISVFDQNTPEADAGEDIEICAALSATATTNALDLDPYDPANGTWNAIQGFGIIEDIDDNVTLIENLPIGTNQFTWTVENGNCPGFPSVDTLEIRVYDPNHPFPDAGDDQEFCAPISSYDLSGTVPIDPAVGTWTVINGTGSFSNPNDPNATVSNLSIGLNTFQWSIYNGPCNSESVFLDEVSITVYDPNVAQADAGLDQTFCDDDFTQTTLDASSFAFPATGVWSVVSPLAIDAVDILSDITDPNAVLSGITNNEYVLRWTINNGPCATEDNFDDVTISLFPFNQVEADAGEDVELCTPIGFFALDGNAPLVPAIGTWTVTSGGGSFSNPNDPLTSVTNLSIGVNVFRWTIDNGACGGVANFDEVTITVFDDNAEPADAGDDQELCTDDIATLTIQLTGNDPSGPADGEWSIIQGGGTFSNSSDPNATLTNAPFGTNIYQWTIDNGSCDVLSNFDQVEILVFNANEPDAEAGTDIEICSDEPSVTLNGNTPSDPATGSWTVVQGNGTFSNPSDPNTEVTGYSNGTNTYRWTINNAPCVPSTSFDDVVLTVYNADVEIANAGEDLDICNNFGPVVLNATSFQAPATGQWVVVSGSGTFSNANDPNSLVSNWDIGDNVYEWSVNNGPCSGGENNDQITVTVFDINADQANAGDDQELCLPVTSTTLNASLPSSPSTGFWTVISGSGVFLDDTDPATPVSGLSVGVNVFRWTIDNGACSSIFSEDDVSILLFEDGANIADAGPDQNFCEPVSSTLLQGNSPISPSTGFWTLIGGSGDINDPTDPNTSVSNLGQGINTFEWTLYGGPCIGGDSSDQVNINIFDDEHPSAEAGDDQELCTPENSTTLNGSMPVSPAIGTWIQVSGPNAATFDPTNNATPLTDLIPGVYVFQWQIDNGPCDALPLTDQVTINVFDSTADDADAGIDQNLCTPNNSTTLNANSAVGAAVGTWTITSGSGSIVNPNDPQSIINNLGIGTNVLVWTIDNGNCGNGTTSDSMTIMLFDSNSPDADAGDDQSLCTPDDQAILVGSVPISPATVTWELFSGSGLVVSPSSTTTQITGLAIGENIFTYTVNNGPCTNGITTDQVSIFVFDSGAPAAFAGDDQEICSPISSTVMTADAALNPGIGTWNLISGNPSVIIDDINSPTTEISNLEIGTYVFEWSLDYSTCGTQSDEVIITVYDSNLDAANAGDDIILCTVTNDTNLNADPVSGPAFGTWSIFEGSGSITDLNDPQTEVTSLSTGENIFVWTIYNGGCSPVDDLSDTVSVFVYGNNFPEAFAGIDQEFCSTTDTPISANMTAIPLPNPTIGTWSVIQGAGTFTNINDPNTEVTGIPVGVNIFEWTADYNGCVASTSDQVIINVFDENQLPANAGPDQSFCTPASSAQLAANATILPATGFWSIIVGTAVLSDINDPNATVTGLNVGVNILRWTILNGPCDPSSTNDLITIFVYDENAANALTGPDQELCLPDNSSNLTGNLPVFPGLGTWSQIEGTSTIQNVNNPNSPVSNLSQGENIFVWEIFNGPCANSITSDTLIISVFDPTNPSADAGEDQEVCSFNNSVLLAASDANIPAVGTWSQVSGIPAVITNINDPNTSVTDLSIGINIFQWTVYNGPCVNSLSSDVVTINVYDENQNDADAGADQNICLPVNSTNFAANAPTIPAIGVWELISGSGTIGDSNNPTSTVTDLGLGENTFTWTISNGPCVNGLTVDTMRIEIFDNEADAALAEPDIEECDPVTSITIDANEPLNATVGYWTQLSGDAVMADSTQFSTDITNLNVGTYIFEWTLDNGSCGISSDSLVVDIFDPNGLDADAGPNQSFCTPVNSAVLAGSPFISPATGTWEILAGSGTILNPSDPNSVITNLTIGETIVGWTVYNGPCSGTTTDFVSIFIFDENAPDANAGDDQELCLPDNGTTFSATPAIFPAIGIWSLHAGAGDIGNLNSPDSPISNLPVGENIFVWTVDNSPCENGLTTDTVSIFVYPTEFDLANAGVDQSHCTPQDSAIMDALIPDIPSIGTWSLVDGSASIVNVNDPSTQIIQLGIGTNTFGWEVYHGPCDPETSLDFMTISIHDDQHPPADAGPDQEWCLPQDNTAFAALPTMDPAVGTWSVISGNGNIATLNDATSQVSDLPVGENFFLWTVDNGPCDNPITTDTVCIKIFTEDAAPAQVGDDITLCGQNSVNLNATIPDSPTIGTWTVISGPTSYTFDDINDPNALFSGLVIGEYELAWTVYNGPCENNLTSDILIVEVFDVNQTPAFAGDDLEFCWPVDTVFINANPVTMPSIGTWTLAGTGTIDDVNDPNTFITNTAIGSHTLTWTVDNGPCGITSDDLVVDIFDPNNTITNAGPDQSICTSDNGGNMALMAANIPVPPAYGTWTTVFGSQPIIPNVNDPTTTMTNFGYGETQLVWEVYNGPCDPSITQDTISIFHFDSENSAANAGLDQEYCSVPNSIQLQGSAVIGNTAIGTWTAITVPANAGAPTIANINNESTFVTDLSLGVYEFEWTIDNGFCGTTTDTVVVNLFSADIAPAYAGEDTEICEDEFEIFNLNGGSVSLPATVSWQVLSGDIELDLSALDTPDPEVYTLGVLPITPFSEIENVLLYTLDNGICGTTIDTVTYTLIDCLSIEVPDAFSPNADFINDNWEIPNIEKYPNNNIKIFNRWGTKIYERDNYQNDWNGFSEHPLTIGEELPVGTYYYVLDLGNGSSVFKGFVYLKR